jgi:hypothetical protein
MSGEIDSDKSDVRDVVPQELDALQRCVVLPSALHHIRMSESRTHNAIPCPHYALCYCSLLAEVDPAFGSGSVPGAYGAADSVALPSSLRSAEAGRGAEAYPGVAAMQQQQQQHMAVSGGGVVGIVVGGTLAAATVALGVLAWRRHRGRRSPSRSPDYITRYRPYEDEALL